MGDHRWTVEDSRALYNVRGWGDDLFDIGDNGHVHITTELGTIDLHELVGDCQRRGLQLPLLLRFDHVLKARLDRLAAAMTNAIEAHDYQGQYRGVFPVKVNQNRHVIEDIVRYGARWRFGLEAGSKPELLLALSRLKDKDALLVVNGYKDRELLETALFSRRLGYRTVVVVEQPWELPLLLDIAEEMGIPPICGLRMRLTSRGAGKWKASTGDRAKFGLTGHQLKQALELLRRRGAVDALKLLHFHIGSQISSIRAVRDAVNEAAQTFVAIHAEGFVPSVLDVGGGLGVDYDGSRTDFESSTNYDLDEYARTVVDSVARVCRAKSVPEPDLVTEAGRYLVAPGSVLVTDVVGVRHPHGLGVTLEGEAAELAEPILRLSRELTRKNALSSYHEATLERDQALARFAMGASSLRERAAIDVAYAQLCQQLAGLPAPDESQHEELEHLTWSLADTLFCNLSVFQSLPDVWAIQQLFPILPIARLDERPDRQAVLADLTCDSDGKIDRFIDVRDVKRTLPVHHVQPGQPYLLGFFLLGAYQEVLGDLHNLFGDTHVVHVASLQKAPHYRIQVQLEGDTVQDVLGYSQYSKRAIVEPIRRTVEAAYEEGRVPLEVGAAFIERVNRQLASYTYLSSS